MNKQPKIRFIVETVSSSRDANGNRYHFARVTSTITGCSISFETGGERNAASMVKAVGDTWDSIYATECEIPKRQWQAARKGVQLFEGNVTGNDILELEV